MYKIICDTNNHPFSPKPTIYPETNPATGKVVFCLVNFNTEEPVDGYSPIEILNIRNALDMAINQNCSVSDLPGQTFLWEI